MSAPTEMIQLYFIANPNLNPDSISGKSHKINSVFLLLLDVVYIIPAASTFTLLMRRKDEKERDL